MPSSKYCKMPDALDDQHTPAKNGTPEGVECCSIVEVLSKVKTNLMPPVHRVDVSPVSRLD